MTSHLTDDQVYAIVHPMIAKYGRKWAQEHDEYLIDNPTAAMDPDEALWSPGVEAIRNNTVEQFGFGRDCIIAVGREHLDHLSNGSLDEHDIMDYLSVALGDAVMALALAKPPRRSGP